MRHPPSRSSQSGQSLVEMAIVLVALLALSLGAIELARATIAAQAVSAAARTLGRVAASTPDDPLGPPTALHDPGTGPLEASALFDPNLTAIDIDALEAAYPGDARLLEKADAYLADMALLHPSSRTANATLGNRLLLPIMEVTILPGQRLLRLPGTLYRLPEAGFAPGVLNGGGWVAFAPRPDPIPGDPGEAQSALTAFSYVGIVTPSADLVRAEVRSSIAFLSVDVPGPDGRTGAPLVLPLEGAATFAREIR